MANTLILNQPQVFNGLGTLSYTIPAAMAGAWNVQVQVTFPSALAINSAASGSAGIGAGYTPLSNLGAGSGMGLGAGIGGGGEGFTGGDLGTTHGGVGQGFGAGNSYQQPPSAASNAVAASNIGSSLSILVKNNGVTIYTATAPVSTQGGLQFKTSFLAAVADAITVVFSSSASVDNQLNGILSTTSIGQGF